MRRVVAGPLGDSHREPSTVHEVSESVTLGSFDPALVALSFVISVFGSWCGLTCAARARRRTGRVSMLWLFGAAAAIGGGAIWSMHFIGMLAYRSHVLYRLDIPITLLSLVLAVIASGIGLTIAITVRGLAGYVLGGVATGSGVCVMHYTGMLAMKMNGEMSWRPWVIALSVVIAIVAATLALYFALNLERVWMMVAAGVVMGLGVCTMHYTGMLALAVTPSHHLDVDAATSGTDPFSLAMPIFGISSVLLLLLLFAGLFDDVGDAPARTGHPYTAM
jgi:NO-binding membrane sensor protein with MHYT domain